MLTDLERFKPEISGNAACRRNGAKLRRRSFLALAGVPLLCAHPLFTPARAQPAPEASLREAPLELAGDWGISPAQAVLRVLTRTREVCLADLRLVSDRQPERIRVDNHSSGPPAIWLHDDPKDTAWIIVDIGPLDWSKLAYQFGHELGHVLCNSWYRSAQPGPPTQWLEEALAEAFSLRGLGLLAQSWETNPPFAGDAKFAGFIRQYRDDLLAKYKPAPPAPDFAAWFTANRQALESRRGAPEGLAILEVLALLEGDRGCVEDLGAVNRWPARTRIPVEAYLTEWEASCAELGAPGHLPAQLHGLLRLG
jgi:hypothetical protein